MNQFISRKRSKPMWLRDVIQAVPGEIVALGFLVAVYTIFACRRIRVCGYWRTWRRMRQGNILLVANHPSLIETIVLPELFWPWKWFGYGRCVPWSVADNALFGIFSRFIYRGMRCIAVDRSALTGNAMHASAVRHMRDILKNKKGTIIAYPEGGRTCKGNTFHHHNGRTIRACSPTPVRIATSVGATVIPVWISHGNTPQTPESFFQGFAKFFKTDMYITFGEPIRFANPRQVTTDEIVSALLTCGQNHDSYTNEPTR